MLSGETPHPTTLHSSPPQTPPHAPLSSVPQPALPPSPASQELQPQNTPHTHILTISVGQHDLRAALPALVPEFETSPAFVMLTECHLSLSALAELRSTAHRLLQLYAVFANCLTKSTRVKLRWWKGCTLGLNEAMESSRGKRVVHCAVSVPEG